MYWDIWIHLAKAIAPCDPNPVFIALRFDTEDADDDSAAADDGTVGTT